MSAKAEAIQTSDNEDLRASAGESSAIIQRYKIFTIKGPLRATQ